MKQLSEVLSLDGTHVVIDCCQSENPQSPVDHPIMDELYDRSSLSHYRSERKGHTLYASIGILIGLVWDQEKPVEVTCHECGSKYILTKEFITELYAKLKKI